MKCTITITFIVSLIVFGILSGQTRGMPPAQCNPNMLNEVPPRIRKVCVALSTIYELGTAMENYIDDKVSVMRDNSPLQEGIAKRQDVDHVFLRFGRRR
ncbi:hypothetical protein PV327_008710 [Microctonus hyperodae]|uniref:Myosuppressin n=1 Tax=Microctonus hyperodae TaxID=165561 RepID=A0AA39F3Q3_MICHY|nr:hypothetical protein PV327_008710 [Microctonus hyperodae]